MSFLPNTLTAARDEAVLEAIRQGALDPIVWSAVDCSTDDHQGTIYVTSDALSLASVETAGPNGESSQGEHVRFAVSAYLAQDIADLLGCCQTTARIEDLSWLQADVQVEPQLMPATAAMTTTLYMLDYSARVDRAINGRSGLVRTVGKSWVLTPDLIGHRLGQVGAVNYGFHTEKPVGAHGPFRSPSGLTMWQTLGHAHNYRHSDESQTLVLVRPDMLVDGQTVAVADVMQDPSLCGLVSDEGVVPIRHPAIPQTQFPGDMPGGGPSGQSPPDGGLVSGIGNAAAALAAGAVGYFAARTLLS